MPISRALNEGIEAPGFVGAVPNGEVADVTDQIEGTG